MTHKMRLWTRPIPRPTPAAEKYAKEYQERTKVPPTSESEPISDSDEPAQEQLPPIRPLPIQGALHSHPRNMESASQKKRLRTISVSMSHEEIELVRREAKRLKTSVSALIRTAFFFYLDQEPLRKSRK